MPRNRTPLREQTFRIGTIVGGPLIGIVVVIAIAATGGFGSVPPGIVLVALSGVIVLFALALVIGLVIAKRLVGDHLEVAYRAGDDKWRHGRLDAARGRLVLQPYWWQLRIPTGDPIVLEVADIGRDERKPKPSQWWSLNPQLRIIDVTTDKGEFEIGGLPSHLTELRQRIAE